MSGHETSPLLDEADFESEQGRLVLMRTMMFPFVRGEDPEAWGRFLRDVPEKFRGAVAALHDRAGRVEVVAEATPGADPGVCGPTGDCGEDATTISPVMTTKLDSKVYHPDCARGDFLQAVELLAGEVRERLRDEVVAAYHRAFARLRDRDFRWSPTEERRLWAREAQLSGHYARHSDFEEWYFDACRRGDPAVQPLTDALEAWAGVFNLGTGWVMVAALRTIRIWATSPDRVEEPIWFEPGVREFPVPEGQQVSLQIPLPTAVEFAEARPEVMKRHLVDVIGRELREHLDRIAEDAPSPLVKTSETRLRDMEWLVRIQVKGESINSVAKAADVDRKSVREAVAGLRRRLDLPEPRSHPGGRPRGSRTVNRIQR